MALGPGVLVTWARAGTLTVASQQAAERLECPRNDALQSVPASGYCLQVVAEIGT